MSSGNVDESDHRLAVSRDGKRNEKKTRIVGLTVVVALAIALVTALVVIETQRVGPPDLGDRIECFPLGQW